MNFELFFPFETIDGIVPKEIRIAINRMIRYGWDGVCLTTSVETMKKLPLPPSPIKLSDESQAILSRRYGLTVLSDFTSFPQFSRLNLITGEEAELGSLIHHLPTTKYNVISVTPLSDRVFQQCCQTADIDIISLDPSKYLPWSCWKQLKSALNRGIILELLYSHFINEHTRQKFFSAAQNIVFVMRGRQFIISNGSFDPLTIRSPSDVRNLAKLIGIRHTENVTSLVPKAIISQGMSRQTHVGAVRRKHIEVEEEEEEIEIKLV